VHEVPVSCLGHCNRSMTETRRIVTGEWLRLQRIQDTRRDRAPALQCSALPDERRTSNDGQSAVTPTTPVLRLLISTSRSQHAVQSNNDSMIATILRNSKHIRLWDVSISSAFVYSSHTSHTSYDRSYDPPSNFAQNPWSFVLAFWSGSSST
jgi:Trp operon repressor